jgi:hypothetical protein
MMAGSNNQYEAQMVHEAKFSMLKTRRERE